MYECTRCHFSKGPNSLLFFATSNSAALLRFSCSRFLVCRYSSVLRWLPSIERSVFNVSHNGTGRKYVSENCFVSALQWLALTPTVFRCGEVWLIHAIYFAVIIIICVHIYNIFHTHSEPALQSRVLAQEALGDATVVDNCTLIAENLFQLIFILGHVFHVLAARTVKG